MAGPLYAFENYMRDILKGKDRKFKLRAGDEFVHLEGVAKELKTYLLENYELKERQKEEEEEELKTSA